MNKDFTNDRSILFRHELVRAVDTSAIIEEVYPKGTLLQLDNVPHFDHTLSTHPFWYRLKEPNDGNCLYWCILQILEDYNLHQGIRNISDLRYFLLDTLQNNIDSIYTNFDTTDKDQMDTLDVIVQQKIFQYLNDDPSDPNSWGDESDLPIISWVFNLNIYQYNHTRKKWLSSYTNNLNNANTINVFLEYTGAHFNILLPKSKRYSIIEPLDDKYFGVVENIELIPEVKKFVLKAHITSVKTAWQFFKKYNFRNHEDAVQAFNIKQFISDKEFNEMYSHNEPYELISIQSTPKSARPGRKKIPSFPNDTVHSAGSYNKKKTSKRRKDQNRKSRKNL